MPEKQRLIARLDSSGFARSHPELWKFTKFAFFAVFVQTAPNIGSHMGMCYLLRALGVTYLPNFFFFNLISRNMEDAAFAPAVLVYAYIVSTFVGQAIIFYGNRKITFHADINVFLSVFLTVLLALFTIFLNSIIGPAIVMLVERLSFLSESMVQLVSKASSMIVAGIWIYPANRFVIHRVTNPDKEGA